MYQFHYFEVRYWLWCQRSSTEETPTVKEIIETLIFSGSANETKGVGDLRVEFPDDDQGLELEVNEFAVG